MPRSPFRAFPPWLALAILSMALAACAQPAPTTCDLGDGFGCNDCYDADTRCEYDGISVEAASCGQCQARWALYDALCDQGRDEPLDQVDADMVCEDLPRTSE